MSPKTILLNDMLNTLEDEDYDTIIDYIRLLSAARKKERAMQTIAAMNEFQDIIGEDRGWDSEEDLLKDMAKDIPVLSDALYNNVDILLTGDKDFLESEIKHPMIFSPKMLMDYFNKKY